MNPRSCLPWPLLLGLVLVVAGCHGEPSANQGPSAPQVTVAPPAWETVPADDEIFTGRTASPSVVEVRSRATGYLDKVLFKDGDEVAEKAPLYEIDVRPYKAALDRAEGEVTRAEARATRLGQDFQRAQRLVGTAAMSREDYDKIAGDRAEAEAALKSAKANVEVYKLDVEFCKIAAPTAGRISNTLVTPGNLVKSDLTLLTNIVVIDPTWATFDVDEGTMLRLQRLVREGKVQAAQGDEISVFLGTSDEKGFPHKGTLNFIDNRVDPTTGTLRARATFPNPKVNAKGEDDPNGNRVLSPGLFVRIRVPVGEPYKAILVAERALLTEQGQKYVYVVKEGKAVRRLVDVGPLKEGLRVILPAVTKEDGSIAKGLEPSDLVVVNGMQRVRAGQPVTAGAPVPMASMTSAGQAAAEKKDESKTGSPEQSHH
jgi:membrane fusion protein, multidrug efflux system